MTVIDVASDLVEGNLAAFGRHLPELCRQLRAHVPQSRLVENPDGSHDIEFRGQRLYDIAGEGATGPELARQAVERMRGTSRNRLLIHPLDSKSIDATTDVFVRNMLKQGIDSGAVFLEHPIGDSAYHLVVMGLGLGYHLAAFIDLCQPFSICIVEPNLDFLFHSLSVLDWRPILERRAAWPQAVSILLGGSAEELSRQMRAHCRNANPAATDSSLIVSSYANDTMEAAVRLFRRDAHLVHTGLGFFQDEMEMTRTSYFNLVRHDDFRLFLRNDERVDVPAFIVGSGPSIDDDLDFIAANRDRAVIFSCGSALGVLLANGIRPDFQLILETTDGPFQMLESIAKTYDFEGIRLIGSNTISPLIRPLFKERVLFMRQSLSPYSMLSPGLEYSLIRSGPTVTNTGLEAALLSGFQKIYLFGCDLGARSPERHHSRFSPYAMAERTKDYDAGLVFAQSLPERQLGNFGGIVFTNDILTWSRDAMEWSIGGEGAGRQIFNCSDGIKIKGARAQVSSGVRIATSPARKQEQLRKMMAHFPEGKSFDFPGRWAATDWRGRVHDFADRLIDICQQRPERTQDFLNRVCPLLVPDHERLPTFEEYFLRGTVFVSIICADYYARRVHPPEKMAEVRELAYQGLTELIETMVGQSDWFFDHLDGLLTHSDLKEGLRAWKAEPTPSATI